MAAQNFHPVFNLQNTPQHMNPQNNEVDFHKWGYQTFPPQLHLQNISDKLDPQNKYINSQNWAYDTGIQVPIHVINLSKHLTTNVLQHQSQPHMGEKNLKILCTNPGHKTKHSHVTPQMQTLHIYQQYNNWHFSVPHSPKPTCLASITTWHHPHSRFQMEKLPIHDISPIWQAGILSIPHFLALNVHPLLGTTHHQPRFSHAHM